MLAADVRILLIAVLTGLGCNSNLKVKTSISEASCQNGAGTNSCAVLKIVTPDTVTNAESFTLAWEAQGIDTNAGLQLQLSSAADCSTSEIKLFENLSGTSLEVTDLSEGQYYVCLYGKTKDGSTLAATNNGVSLIIDRTPPSLDDLAPIAKNQAITLAPTVIDANSITYLWEIVDGVSGVALSAFTVSYVEVSFSAEGTYHVRLTAKDVAGNAASKIYQVTYDVTPPVVDVGVDVASNSVISKTATVSDPAATLSWSKISGPGQITFSAMNNATTSMNASQDGTYLIRLTATDAVGNVGYDEFSLGWSSLGPAFASLALSGDAADGYINGAEETSTLPLFSLTASGHTSALYSAPLPAIATCDSSVTYGFTTIATASHLGADGSYVICVKLQDVAGNVTYGKSQTVERDTTAPVYTSLVKANEGVDGYIGDADKNATLTTMDIVRFRLRYRNLHNPHG